MCHAMYDCARMKCPSIFFEFFSFFFIFSRFNECEMQMSYANAMIGLTSALCNHCAPICYWQTLNYWPRYQFSMNVNKMWCKSRFFISDANASWRRCKCKFFFYDAKCLLIEMEMRMSFDGYVMMQMLWYRHNSFKNFLYFQNEASSAPETKTFSKLDLLFLKSHLPFGLRLPKIGDHC